MDIASRVVESGAKMRVGLASCAAPGLFRDLPQHAPCLRCKRRASSWHGGVKDSTCKKPLRQMPGADYLCGMGTSISTIKKRFRVSDDARYFTAGQVRERFGVSDTWIYRHIKQHDFPKPVRFGGPTSARRWLRSDIEDWERERVRRNA
jgi:predicted DNA-binding transcriptional regulator AlpA